MLLCACAISNIRRNAVAADLDERRAKFLASVLMKRLPELRLLHLEMLAKKDRTLDEDEDVKLLSQVTLMMKRNKVPETRPLGSWIVEVLLEADPT
jgi:hypothetical protein